jgi:hypothetical protein
LTSTGALTGLLVAFVRLVTLALPRTLIVLLTALISLTTLIWISLVRHGVSFTYWGAWGNRMPPGFAKPMRLDLNAKTPCFFLPAGKYRERALLPSK